MSFEVYRTPRAREDIISAAAYLAMDNLDAARRFLRAIRADAMKLAEMPGMGALRGYRRAGLETVRSWPVGGFRNYLIFYRPVEDGIEIIRLLHGARDPDRFFE